MWCFQSWILTSYKSQKQPLIHRVLFGLRSSPKQHPGPCASALQSPGMWGRVLLILGLQLISRISPQTPSSLPWNGCPSLPIRGIPCKACVCGVRPYDASGRPLSLAFDLLLTTSGFSVELGCEGICKLKTMVSPLWDSPGPPPEGEDYFQIHIAVIVMTGVAELSRLDQRVLVLPQCSIHAILRKGGLPWRIKAVASTEPWVESQRITVSIGIIHSSVLFQSLGRMR